MNGFTCEKGVFSKHLSEGDSFCIKSEGKDVSRRNSKKKKYYYNQPQWWEIKFAGSDG